MYFSRDILNLCLFVRVGGQYHVLSTLSCAQNGSCSSRQIQNGTYKLKLLGEDGWVRRNIARSHRDFRANKKKDEGRKLDMSDYIDKFSRWWEIRDAAKPECFSSGSTRCK